MKAKKAVIIVAGGKGLRMQTDIPKQFIEICGKPLLMHTIENFYRFDAALQIILVLPEPHFGYWDNLCKQYDFSVKHTTVAGGDTRFQSVLNGLKHVIDTEIVAVHDGVRPLVSHDTIKRCFDAAFVTKTAIPVVDCVESIREVDADGNRAVDRSLYKLVQTPQVFNTQLLLEAYNQPFTNLFTDDASVVEHYFELQKQNAVEKISLVEGNRENIKITTPFDLKIAEAFLKI